jgi:hypothetical protein
MPMDQRQLSTRRTTCLRPSWSPLVGLALIIITAAPVLAGEAGLIPPGGNLKGDG